MNVFMVNMAINIADESSQSLIECCGVDVRNKAGALLWYEVDPQDPIEGYAVRDAMKYLHLRGKLRVNPKNPNQVKVRQ